MIVKYIANKYILILSIMCFANLSAISMVYNFRIAQITKQPISEEANYQNVTLIGLLFEQFLKKYNGVHQNFAGGLGSGIYNLKPYYFRADFAVGNISEKVEHQPTFSTTEMDDILFTVGRNFILNKSNVTTLSGLFGIPTHKLFRLKHVDFGYSQVGLGAQFDGSGRLNHTSSLLYGARYIYFIPRSAHDSFDKKHTFSIGNIADLLIACKNSWNNHGLEFGYTSRFQFGASCHPKFDDIVKKSNYIRNNFYIVYKYKFLIKKVQNRLLFYAAYGFDSSPKVFGYKYVVTFWTSWNISF